MAKQPDFNQYAAHKYYSVNCFNAAWDLIDKLERSPEEDQEMLRLSMVSLWHWSQREDCSNKNISVGCWQISRLFALLGQVENARWYGELSLDASKDGEPFYIGYAYEALARVELQAENTIEKEKFLQLALEQAAKVSDAEWKKMLLDDLETIS